MSELAVYRINNIQTGHLGSTIRSVCLCDGNHLLEIPHTEGLIAAKKNEDGSFEDSAAFPHIHKPPVKKGDMVTLIDQGGKTAGAWVDKVSLGRIKRWFPEENDNLAWVIEIRKP